MNCISPDCAETGVLVMNKAQKLLDHILLSPLQLKRDDVMLLISNGKAVSYVSSENNNFSMKYEMVLVITDYAGNADALQFIILQWMAINQPDHDADAFSFEADIINHNSVDLTIKISLDEVIKVTITPTGISLAHIQDPSLEPFWLNSPQWQLFINDVLQ